jgi:hypothetical protein
VPLRTLRRWVSRYRSEGLTSLARKERSDKGKDRLAGRSGEVILALALGRPRRSVAAMHRKAAEVARREGWAEPTYDQVRGFVKRIDPALAKLAREGVRSYGRRLGQRQLEGFVQADPLALQDAFDGVAQVLEEMPAIGYLDGTGGGRAYGVYVGLETVATRGFHTRMLL